MDASNSQIPISSQNFNLSCKMKLCHTIPLILKNVHHHEHTKFQALNSIYRSMCGLHSDYKLPMHVPLKPFPVCTASI